MDRTWTDSILSFCSSEVVIAFTLLGSTEVTKDNFEADSGNIATGMVP